MPASHFKDWPGMATALLPAIKNLHKGQADVMKAFREMGAAAHGDGALDAKTKELLILAYPNEQALNHTLTHGIATFWSTSRNELWIKGATSGDTLAIVEVRVNCEQNSLLYLVQPLGEGSCHTKNSAGKARSGCYYRRIDYGQLIHA